MNEIRTVCIYSASSTQVPEAYFKAAREVGELCALHHIRIVNGAGRSGLMRACADACLSAGGKVTGVIPSFMIEQGWQHTGLTELIETPDMHSRKETMADLSDGVIALPGGCGTLEELLEVITWKQLGLYLKPVIILNTDGFFNPLLEMLNKAVDEHFMRPEHLQIWRVAATPLQAVEFLYTTPLWSKEIQKYAAI